MAVKERGVFGSIKRELRRCSAIEAAIGHMKTDGHLGHCFLEGAAGDTANVSSVPSDTIAASSSPG
jgi:transposase, IS5 family